MPENSNSLRIYLCVKSQFKFPAASWAFIILLRVRISKQFENKKDFKIILSLVRVTKVGKISEIKKLPRFGETSNFGLKG